MIFLTALTAQAQITIGGSIYGGGNAGNTGGKTTVNVYAGNLHAVFAGARMANVGGSAFVHIDGEHASDYILADYVYGGNDISGTIGTSENLPLKTETSDGLTEVGTEAGKNSIDNTWNAFVRISTKTTTTGEAPNTTVVAAADAKSVYIGQLFGGGNGYYKYDPQAEGPGTVVKDKVTDEVIVSGTTVLSAPEISKAYLEVLGGSIVYAFGGGNNATVTENTVICVDNPSEVVNSIKDTRVTTENDGELLTSERFQKKMRLNIGFSYPSSGAFQIGSFFGGNNMAEMKIRPTWNLKSGKIRNLYSGGNQGRMTSPDGLLLEILAGSTIIVDNVYGGCRMADVHPLNNATDVPSTEIQLPEGSGYNFPAGLSARVVISRLLSLYRQSEADRS